MNKIGDTVEVYFEPDGWLPGIVQKVLANYGFHGGELKFEVHGTKRPYITIVSHRTMRKVVAQ